MRSYLIDDISPLHMEKIKAFLRKNAIRSSLEQVFWIRIPDDLLSPAQFEHRNCGPHVFALELGTNWVKLEFFVRSLKTLRCSCPGYCTRAQMEFVVSFAHRMVEESGVRT